MYLWLKQRNNGIMVGAGETLIFMVEAGKTLIFMVGAGKTLIFMVLDCIDLV